MFPNVVIILLLLLLFSAHLFVVWILLHGSLLSEVFLIILCIGYLQRVLIIVFLFLQFLNIVFDNCGRDTHSEEKKWWGWNMIWNMYHTIVRGIDCPSIMKTTYLSFLQLMLVQIKEFCILQHFKIGYESRLHDPHRTVVWTAGRSKRKKRKMEKAVSQFVSESTHNIWWWTRTGNLLNILFRGSFKPVMTLTRLRYFPCFSDAMDKTQG